MKRLIFILITIICAYNFSYAQNEREQDSLALVALYDATNGPYWNNNSGWLDPNMSVSEWYGVAVENGRVTGISLDRNNLSGYIPGEIGQLDQLTQLSLAFNEIGGIIPNEIGRLSKVFDLNLLYNNISGDIPIEMCNMSSLGWLGLSSNKITGTIPDGIWQLSNLERILIDKNQLTGEIPADIGNLNKLNILNIATNKFSGVIPDELYKLHNLESMNLQSNQFVGSISPDIGQLSNLKYLNLSYNELTGPIPKEIGNLVNLQELRLYFTQVSGSIPPEIGFLHSLNRLYMGVNNIEGGIPIEICNIDLLTVDFSTNRLDLSSCPAIKCLAEKGVRFAGDPNQTQQSGISLINGCLPNPVSESDSLALVALYNATDGPNWTNNDGWLEPGVPVSEWFGIDCWNGQIITIVLEGNNLSGSLPVDIFNIISLEHLYLMGNHLNGVIPEEMGNLLNVKDINLSDNNQLEGEIPSTIVNCTNLHSLHLANCNLSGILPVELCQLPLVEINIEANHFDSQSCSVVHCLFDNGVNFVGDIWQRQADGSSIFLECGNTPNAETCSIQDSLALVALYNATGGDNWNNNDYWLSEYPVALWHGVYVNPEDGRVHYLELFDNNLIGYIPDEFYNLTELRWIGLHGNSELGGEISPLIGNLIRLNEIHSNATGLTGSIPAEIGNCTDLTTIHIEVNNFSGPLPSELCNLPLSAVNLTGNNFEPSCEVIECMVNMGVEFHGDVWQYQQSEISLFKECGIIPNAPPVLEQDSLALVALYNSTGGDFWNKNEFWLSEFPVAVWQGVRVEEGRVRELHELYDNNMNGTLPPEFFNLTELEHIVLWENPGLSGDLSGIGNFSNLHNVHIWNTSVGGVIPTSIGNCINLGELVIGSNNFEGIIPSELCNTSVYELNFEANKFSAESCPVIECLLGKGAYFVGDPYQTQQSGIALAIECGKDMNAVPDSEMQALIALYNATDGPNWTKNYGWLDSEVPVSEWFGVTVQNGSVTSISLPGNNLTGEIPPEIGNLTKLLFLGLQTNQISGIIPSEIGNLINLKSLFLQFNQLTGSLPKEIGSLSNLTTLFLWNNQIEGSIPAEIGQLGNLVSLLMWNNNLSGTIPAEIGQLNNLKNLALFNNQISGLIPIEITQIESLGGFNLSNNKLIGDIPKEFGYMRNLTLLNVGNNELSGIIPMDLCGENIISRVDFSGNNFDNNSCPAISCLIDKGVTFQGDPEQIQKSGFSLINGCDCVTPELEYVTATTEPVQLGNEIEITFYAPLGYIESAYWEWGDGTLDFVDVEGEITTSHLYTEPGVYAPKLTLVGCNDVTDTTYRYVVIYDPEGGFVTGAGWIESPEGASVLYPEATGKAHFGFVSKYKKGATVPEGRTEFKFTAGNLDYQSNEYEWLVVAGSKAKFKGVGTINNEGNYGFIISAIDGDIKEKGDPDNFRIKIWNQLDEIVVYDNQMNAGLDEDPATEIGAGSIVIHDPNLKGGKISVGPEQVDEEFTIYPNPTSGKINIYGFVESVQYSIKLVDMTGKCVFTKINNSSETQIDVSYLPASIYNLLIIKDKEVKSYQIIKN